MNIFITGTDTDVGKTYIACELLKKFNSLGFSTFGIKPIASGCFKHNGQLVNEDALTLQKTASVKTTYDLVNPIAFELPIAPHVAADSSNVSLTIAMVLEKMQKSLAVQADIKIIEGVGGWLVPLNNKETMADVVCALNIPVILVVAVKLGCLNHALLTVAAIEKMQIPLIGWVANCMQPEMLAMKENITTLKNRIAAPCLEVVSLNGIAEEFCNEQIINFLKNLY